MNSSSSSSSSSSPSWTVGSLKEYIFDHRLKKESEVLPKADSLTSTESLGSSGSICFSVPEDEEIKAQVATSSTDPKPATSSPPESLETHWCITGPEFEEILRKNLELAREQQLAEPVKELSPLTSLEREMRAIARRVERTSIIGIGMNAGIASFQGSRKVMEDRGLFCPVEFLAGKERLYAHVGGVFDGHGSATISEFLKRYLPIFLQATLEIYNEEALTDYGIWKALRASFKWLHRLSPDKETMHGSTAAVAFIPPESGVIWVANTGDSRAIYCPDKPDSEEEKCIALSADASLGNPVFRQRVLDLGAEITSETSASGTKRTERVEGCLALAASIGAHRLVNKQGKSCIPYMPDVVRYPNTKKGTLVVASDGLWSRCSSLYLSTVIASIKTDTCIAEEIAQGIVCRAVQSKVQDNTLVLVIPLFKSIHAAAKKARHD